MSETRKELSRSALVLAARRAVDAASPEPLIDDRYARLLTTEHFMRFAERESDAIHYVLLRHRLLDDFASGHGHSHAVLLGAGLDTKSVRHPHLRVIEVDSDEMVRYKRSRLEDAGHEAPRALAMRVSSPADLVDVLQCVPSGLSSVVIAEGFFMYYLEEWLDKALAVMAGALEPAPNLGFDLLAPEYFAHPENQAVTHRLAQAGEFTRSGRTPESVSRHLESLGYEVDIWTPSRLANHYFDVEWRGRNDKYVVIATHISSEGGGRAGSEGNGAR